MTAEQREIFVHFVRPVWEECLLNAGYPLLVWRQPLPWLGWLTCRWGRWEPA